MRPKVNSYAQPRGDLYNNIERLLFNAPKKTTTHERTSQQPNTITFLLFPILPFPLASIKGREG
jgi:hypothetical protein